jgi:hypothetical protein
MGIRPFQVFCHRFNSFSVLPDSSLCLCTLCFVIFIKAPFKMICSFPTTNSGVGRFQWKTKTSMVGRLCSFRTLELIFLSDVAVPNLSRRIAESGDWQDVGWKNVAWFLVGAGIFLRYQSCCDAQPASCPVDTGGSLSRLIDWLIMSMGLDVSEPRPQTGLLFILRLMCECGEPWWWWCRLRKTPDSSTRALWKLYQQRRLGAGRRNGRRSENCVLVSEIRQRIYNML